MKKKIVFTSDLLRIQNDEYFSPRVLAWAYPLLEQSIKYAAGEVIPCDSYNIEIFSPKKFYELCGYEPNTENWINICSGKYTDEALEYFNLCFKDFIVITQEAGCLSQFFEKLNIPCINFYISAIRFCSDIHLAFTSNIPEVMEKLTKYKIPEEQFYIEAGALKTFYGRRNLTLEIEKNSVLLCGQTSVDLSLINDGRIVQYRDIESKINDLTSRYDKIYYKPHPFANPKCESEQYIYSIPNLEVINKNTYSLLCHKNITAVAALSSGILIEAKYFGKEAITLSHEYVSYWDGESKIKKGQYITVYDEYRNPKFWAEILSPVVKNVNYLDIHITTSNNYLRKLIHGFWSYEIDNLDILNHKIFCLNDLVIKRTVSFRNLRKIIACVVPIKSWRKKIRGDR